jgi:hypothetical protein
LLEKSNGLPAGAIHRFYGTIRGGNGLLRRKQMLELRPTCEHCDRALPPESIEAMICSFECTFCRDCVERHFGDVCPNCGGNLTARPIRPVEDRRGGNYLGNHPASTAVVHSSKDLAAHAVFRKVIESIPADER